MSAHAPLLRADLAIVEQVYRGEQSFVVKDPTTQAYFRFRPVEIRVMRKFDGARPINEIAEALVAEGIRVSVATVAGFAKKLGGFGLLEATLRERTTQQLERLRNERRRKASIIRGELFRLRVPFGDSRRFLARTYPFVRGCFTRTFVIASAALFVAYFGIVTYRRHEFATELSATFSSGALTPWRLVLLVSAFAALTYIHEMGHALACKHFGGEVREMGFMLLFLMPAFYANVNDAWSFPERRARLWVTFAGPWIELTVTSVLALLWLVAAPGTLFAQFAVAAMAIGGIANILTNLNPLLPLDGYFALGDWLEIPNLRHRAKALVASSFRRRLLRVDEPEIDVDPRQRRILFWYGVTSALYVFGFLLFIAARVVGAAERTLGTLVAGLVVLAVLGVLREPISVLARGVGVAWHAWRVRGDRTARWRTWRRVALGGAVMLLLATLVPCDLTSSGAFTVMPISMMAVTAPDSGVVSDVFVREGDRVVAGAPVLRVAEYTLDRGALSRERSADSLAFGAARALARARTGEGEMMRDEARGAAAAASETRARLTQMRVLAAAGGVVASPRPERLRGRHVNFGDTLVVLGDFTEREAIVRVSGDDGAEIRVGQLVRLISTANGARAFTGTVDAVSVVGGREGTLEARVRVPADAHLHSGATGDARVVVRRGTVLGAVARVVRRWVRPDLLL